MTPKCEESLSSFAFNCNLRHYSEGGGNNLYGDELVTALKLFDAAAAPGAPGDLSAYILMVGRCRCMHTPA